MKKRKLFSGAAALLMSMMLPMTAIAGTHTVGTCDELVEAFADKDADVYIVLSADISVAEQGALEAAEGQKITIDGQTYVLSDLWLAGAGEVVINADLKGKNYKGLEAAGKVNVTVNRDIQSEYYGVYAYEDSNVTVNGNIQSGYDGVYAYGDSNVTVNGDIQSGYAGYDGVYAYEDSNVTVNGDIQSEGKGVYAYEESNVTVNGDIQSGNDGVYADGDSSVTVDGNVTGGSGTAPDEEGNLDVGTMDSPDGFSDGATGIYANGNSSVTVTGDVTGGDAYGTYGYAGGGVEAYGEASVKVDGNVTGGSVTAKPEAKGEGYESSAGDGVFMESTAKVEVGGNVTGGNTNGDSGYAGKGAYIFVSLKEVTETNEDGEEVKTNIPGQFFAGGTVTGGTAENGYDAEGIYYEVPKDIIEEDLKAEVKEQLEQLAIPEVTVYAVVGGGDAKAIANNMGNSLFDEAFQEEANYVINTEDVSNGTVTVDKETAKAGDTVVVTPTADDGYKVSKVSVNGKEITAVNGVYSFTVEAGGNVTVSVEFVKIPAENNGTGTGTGAGEAGTGSAGTGAAGTGSAGTGAAGTGAAGTTPTPTPATSPETGDSNAVVLFMVMMVASVACVAVGLFGKKRRYN